MPEIDGVLEALRGGVPAADLEGPCLEFKQEGPTLKKTLEVVADAVVCLANADGGTVVLGVADAPGPPGPFLGVAAELTADVLSRGVFERTRPQLSVPVQDRAEGPARLLVITVPRGATLYANARGTATRRRGSQCVPFPPEEQRQALAARGLHDWSAEPCGSGMSAADPVELDRLRRLLRNARKDELAGRDSRQLLTDLRLLTVDGELTRAGLLLVGREDRLRSVVPSYGYAYQYRPTPGGESTTRVREYRPILAAIERILDLVDARRLVHAINVSGGVQLQVHDYSLSAVRELVINALVHRDYLFEGSVEIEHSPEQLLVTNPGGLVFGVTPDNILTHPSTPRNRLLLEAVTALQVAERTGQGVDRVYRELLRSGKRPPVYLDDGVRVQVLVDGGTGDDAFVRFVNNELGSNPLWVEFVVDVDVLLALNHLRHARTINATALAAVAQRSVLEAQRILQRLAHAGLVEPSRRTARRPFPSYSLSAPVLTSLGRAVSYHRRQADGLDRKVVEHVREYGHVTNQALRRMFDVNVYGARDMLRDLQQRGILSKIDDRAGPGVRYGPGPRFPATGRRGSRPPT